MDEKKIKAFNLKKQAFRVQIPSGEIEFMEPTFFEIHSAYDTKYKLKHYNLYFIRLAIWKLQIFCSETMNKMRLAKKSKTKHKILSFLHQYEFEHDVLFSAEIIRGVRGDYNEVKDMIELLKIKDEIGYKESEYRGVGGTLGVKFFGYFLTDTGKVSFYEDKYINEARDIWHLKRSRFWAFFNGPIVLICTVVSVLVAIYQVDRNDTIEKNVKQLDTATRLLDNRLFEMEINNLKMKRSETNK